MIYLKKLKKWLNEMENKLTDGDFARNCFYNLEMAVATKTLESIEEIRSQKINEQPNFQTENELYEFLGMKIPYWMK